MSMVGIKHYLSKRGSWFFLLSSRGLLNRMDDETYLKLLFRYSMGTPLDLEHPKTYNEKLQWLKLHDRRPLYTQLVDKLAVKDYVAEKIGPEYVIPVIAGPWDSVEEIDFDALPDQFVLKCTHDSGGVVICRSKSSFDIEAAKDKLAKFLHRNFYWANREWPYKDVKPRLFAEPYLEDESGELRDYKFFVFDAAVRALYIASDRSSKEETKFDFFDADFRHLPFTNGHPNAPVPPEKPRCFEEMKALAARLGAGFPQVRVDLYEVAGHVYFGEYTFFHWSGLCPFDPPSWDQTFGSWIHLPIDEEQPFTVRKFLP